jgi:hypothetical protein
MQNAVNFFLGRLSQNPIHLTILQLIPIIPKFELEYVNYDRLSVSGKGFSIYLSVYLRRYLLLLNNHQQRFEILIIVPSDARVKGRVIDILILHLTLLTS